jgi:pimeloyl-ACP methyl ester carboxylesterase
MRRSLSVVFACCLFLSPAVSFAADRSFDSGGVKIHYIDEGQGEPVLLIHGFAANTEIQWVGPRIVDNLAKDYRVIALDNRGHGQSGKPHDPKQYGMQMVEDAIRLLDHLKIDKAHVIGYSMGAMITNKLITMYPERVLTATLGGAAGILEGADTQRFQPLIDSLEKEKSIGPLMIALTPPGKPKPTEQQIKVINQLFMANNDAMALAAVVRSWPDLVVPEAKLKANKVPTLAIVGAIDPLKTGVDELKGRMANVQLIVIDNADHMTAFRSPEFIGGVRKFLSQTAGNGKVKKSPVAVPAGPDQ